MNAEAVSALALCVLPYGPEQMVRTCFMILEFLGVFTLRLDITHLQSGQAHIINRRCAHLFCRWRRS
jgi:hypothetical protein